MQTLVLTIALGLIAALQAQDPQSYQEPDISGRWYVKAILADRDYPVEKVYPITFSVLSGGDVRASSTHTINGQCHEVETVLDEMDVPGEYSAFGGTSHLLVEGTPVEDHLVFHCEGQFKGERFRVAKLLGRSPHVSLEALEAFKKSTQRKGCHRRTSSHLSRRKAAIQDKIRDRVNRGSTAALG